VPSSSANSRPLRPGPHGAAQLRQHEHAGRVRARLQAEQLRLGAGDLAGQRKMRRRTSIHISYPCLRQCAGVFRCCPSPLKDNPTRETTRRRAEHASTTRMHTLVQPWRAICWTRRIANALRTPPSAPRSSPASQYSHDATTQTQCRLRCSLPLARPVARKHAASTLASADACAAIMLLHS
jgi:hypothetical protein